MTGKLSEEFGAFLKDFTNAINELDDAVSSNKTAAVKAAVDKLTPLEGRAHSIGDKLAQMEQAQTPGPGSAPGYTPGKDNPTGQSAPNDMYRDHPEMAPTPLPPDHARASSPMPPQPTQVNPGGHLSKHAQAELDAGKEALSDVAGDDKDKDHEHKDAKDRHQTEVHKETHPPGGQDHALMNTPSRPSAPAPDKPAPGVPPKEPPLPPKDKK